jgi:SAM-dependent methyltransferase
MSDISVPPSRETADTRDAAYTERLTTLTEARWKRLLNVQAPYRWNLRRLGLGRTLDVGCGIGRNLLALPPGSVGVDHNPHSVRIARSRGLTAHGTEQFHALARREYRQHFDALLLAHVIEHLSPRAAHELVTEYLPYLRPSATLVLICPQEAGFRSDASHVTFQDFPRMRALAEGVGAQVTVELSFPFPRPAGRLFRYNEFVLLGQFPMRPPGEEVAGTVQESPEPS